MFKKVCICSVLVSFLLSMSLHAQNTAPILPEHVRTAQRYADLAIQSYVSDAVETAISYAEMALAYNENCSDALYVRGLSAERENETLAVVQSYYEKALKSNSFYNYSYDIVRLALAEQYTAQHRYADTLTLLDASPKLLTADAQYLRCVCYYKTGNLKDARALISSIWRIYPRDIRFPKLFFTSEVPVINGENAGFDPAAAATGEKLISNLKNWGDSDPELYLYASAFVPRSEALKLLKQYTSWVPMNKRVPFYAAQGLHATYLTPDEAIERFELLSSNVIDYRELEHFAAVLSADTSAESVAAQKSFKEWLSRFSGVMILDSDDSGSITVQYRDGRPLMAVCDALRDGEADWQCAFDYGVPRQFIDNNRNATVVYARYPFVASVHTGIMSWELLPDTVQWSSITVEPCPFISNNGTGRDFYVPVSEYTGDIPDEAQLRPAAWKVNLNYDITMSHDFEYQLDNGRILQCTIITPQHDRSVITFTDSIPVKRVTDLNSDGFDDVTEYFEVVNGEPSDEDMELTRRLYGPFTPDAVIRLSRMEIESESLELQGFVYDIDADLTETLTWDTQADGSYSQKFVRYADDNAYSYSIVDPLQDELITITVHEIGAVEVEFNGIPISVAYDKTHDFYWIGENDGVIEELQDIAEILRSEAIRAAGEKPAVTISRTIDGVLYMVSKNNDWYFGTRRINEDIPLN